MPEARGPADFDPQAEIQRHAGKQRIPLSHVAVAGPLQRDRFGPIKDRQESNAADGCEVIREGPDERFARSSGTIVTSSHREYFKRVAKKCTRFSIPAKKPDIDVSEIELGEFTSQALEPDERPDGLWAAAR